ncbi:hypothetical protein BOQ60_24560, partial [Chryseobacterium sp. CH1]
MYTRLSGKNALCVMPDRQMVHLAAFKLDSKDTNATTYCAMAKRLATDMCFNICNEALQILGGYGCTQDFPV